MPKINVYLPDDLADAVKDSGLPVSAICQASLELAVRHLTDIRAVTALDHAALGDPGARLAYFTVRARTAVRLAAEHAQDAGADTIGTEHLLGGLLAEGSNLALRVMRSLEIEPADVQAALDARRANVDQQASPRAAGGEAPALRMDGRAAGALELSAIEAFSLGHNYVGCEHVLLGLIAEPDGAAGQLLRSLGADQRITRRVVAAALGGYVHARSQAKPQPVPQSSDCPALHDALQPLTQLLARIEERLAILTAPPTSP